MMGPFAFCVKLLITLDTLVLVPSWKVDCLHMNQRIGPSVADLATQHTLELSNVLSLSEFAGVPVETLFNLFSIFPFVISILHLQCSQVLHKFRSKEFRALFASLGTEAKSDCHLYIEWFSQPGFRRGF